MYTDALTFLDEEREAWRPYEALEGLADEALDRSVEAANGWSGRDLMAHMVFWQDIALQVARDLAVGETSPTIARIDAEWETRGPGWNDELMAEWRTLPIGEVRRRFRETAGELRGTLTVVPETRWVKHAEHLKSFTEETLDHYAEHLRELEAILAASG